MVRNLWIQKFLDFSQATERPSDLKKHCLTEAVMVFILTYILLIVFCRRVQYSNY
jgi:hypothetical protein